MPGPHPSKGAIWVAHLRVCQKLHGKLLNDVEVGAAELRELFRCCSGDVEVRRQLLRPQHLVV